MRLGVSVYWRGARIDATREIAQEADRLGFDYLWITEAWGMEALSTIGYLFGITKKIKIGPGVLNVFSRSAALIGMAAATFDQMAPGRFVLGLGASGRILVESWHRMKFERPLERTREYIEIIRKVSLGEPIEPSRFKLYTTPSRESPEIYLGAIGERNLRLAGEIADGAIVTMYPISRLSNALDLVNEESHEGRRRKKIFAYLPAMVTESEQERISAKSEVARNIAFYVASMGSYYAKNLSRLGFGESVEKIQKAYSTRGSKGASEAVDDALIDELSLIGTSDEIRKKLSRAVSTSEEIIPVLGLDASRLGAAHLETLFRSLK